MTDARCYRCSGTYTNRGMTRHLRTCKAEASPTREREALHVSIRDAHRAKYRLHLSVTPGTTLDELDGFLRDVWLECCGHVSAFEIDGDRYEKPYVADQSSWGYERFPMDPPLGSVLGVDDKIRYEYDFGTTNELDLRVLNVDSGLFGVRPPGSDTIGVLARNKAPAIECEG